MFNMFVGKPFVIENVGFGCLGVQGFDVITE
jgi:hypothetical protein